MLVPEEFVSGLSEASLSTIPLLCCASSGALEPASLLVDSHVEILISQCAIYIRVYNSTENRRIKFAMRAFLVISLTGLI